MDTLQEKFALRTQTCEPAMTEIELHELDKEETGWKRGCSADSGAIRLVRESFRATIHEVDDWHYVPVRYQFGYDLATEAFFTDVQPVPGGLLADEMYFPLRSLQFCAAYIHVDERVSFPLRLRNKAELIDISHSSLLMPNVLVICDESTYRYDISICLVPHADLDRDVL